MKISTLIVCVIASVSLAGCASKSTRDMDGFKRNIADAESGDFGTCLREMHQSASNLEKAKMYLSMKDRNKMTRKAYQKGMTASQKALQHRRTAEDVCNRRTARLEQSVAALGSSVSQLQNDVGALDKRVTKLEAVREIVRGVTFKTGSAELTSAAKTVLDVVANRLTRKPKQVEIAGYTSSTGTPELNLRLSQKRAESVRAYLIRKGVPANTLTAKGFGMADPIASNDTPEGRRANQRVELHYNR